MKKMTTKKTKMKMNDPMMTTRKKNCARWRRN